VSLDEPILFFYTNVYIIVKLTQIKETEEVRRKKRDRGRGWKKNVQVWVWLIYYVYLKERTLESYLNHIFFTYFRLILVLGSL